MRLDRIKLAGFKSFVDPITLPTPGNLIGIVGPNGCGKSNIIDAVRWVMGESSAKHLRGESMADVIFNGSSSRKPVGLASVELVFDNSAGKAPGEFSAYPEIAIKRQVTRDGQSTYLLNGARCRRRDITDLFLGTGLGSRSYAIIEQGTISRLIEAKPAELRELIEEAAGISRYKERRHETGLRMGHTQENLDRLLDVRDEVSKQLESLKRQARKAEKFTALKHEEQVCREQLLGLRWRQYDARHTEHQNQAADGESRFRALAEQDHAFQSALESRRVQQETLQKSLNAEQGQFYELGSAISRLSQSIRHAQETHENLLQEASRLEEAQQQAALDLENDHRQLDTLREEMAELEDHLEEALEAESESSALRESADAALRNARQQYESLGGEIHRYRNQQDLQQARIDQIEQQFRQTETRYARLTTEREHIEATLDHQQLANLEWSVSALDTARATAQDDLRQLNLRIQDSREGLKSLQHELNARRAEQHTLHGKISSLETLQEHALDKDRASLRTWLTEQRLDDAPRLAEHLEVQPGWESAVETALGIRLKALCVAQTATVMTGLDSLGRESLALVETRPAPPAEYDSLGPRLLDQVRSPWALDTLLGAIYCADDLEAAHDLSRRLASHASVMTPDGTWLGRGWLARQYPDSAQAGIIKRERELKSMHVTMAERQNQVAALETQIQATETSIRDTEQAREQRQAEERQIGAEYSRARAELSAALARCEQASKRLQQIDADLAELDAQRCEQGEDLESARAAWLSAGERLATLEPEAATCADRRDRLEQRLAESDMALRQARDRVTALKSRADSLRTSEQMTSRRLERSQLQFEQARDRLATLNTRVTASGLPTEDSHNELARLVEQKSGVEEHLGRLRQQADALETEMRELSEAQVRNARELSNVKDHLTHIRLELSANEARRQTLMEQFEAMGAQPGQVVSHLPEEADEPLWQQRLVNLGEDIARLGPVNLMAVDELRAQSERMAFLDQQHQDLSESLATLREAIEKIDKECRTRFKGTFDLINAGLQRMFPKLFGGGQASLELTERDLLEAGVTVMARPPGKRNSSIHLLSGGEKALTAAALVFAIFELNPAPFCLLDEVDAPLDDANVGRFSELVKEMSERVQFLFISHNKVTMEIAQHLAGVTMKEPGVSRIVAVDIDAAVALTTL